MANKKTKASQKLKNLRLFYVTTPNIKTARRLSQVLLMERLVACTNIIPSMESMYWWKGRIDKAKECVLILKSNKRLSKALISRVLSLHPYDTACILEIPIEATSEAYGLWLESHLK